MKKIKLLHIQLLPLLSGVQKKMLRLLDALDREKYDIYVICRPGGPLVDKIIKSGYKYIPVTSLRRNLSLWDFISLIKIYLICREYRFDIVHTHSSKTGFLGRIAARLAGTPKIIHTVSGFPFHAQQFYLVRFFYIMLEAFASLFCDYLVIVNEYEKHFIQNTRLFSTKKVLTIFNGVYTDPEMEPRLYGPKGMIKPQKSLPELVDYFVIGSMARFAKAKNIVNFTKVAISVCRENPLIKFVFIGDGEYWDECYDLVASSGMHQQIIMPGWQNNIEYWLMNIDMFASYSYWEGLSNSILEAMSFGLPIIASNIVGNNEQVDDENGILVPVDDHVRFRKILTELPSRQNDLERWSRNSLSKCRELFSLRQFVEGYEKLYLS